MTETSWTQRLAQRWLAGTLQLFLEKQLQWACPGWGFRFGNSGYVNGYGARLWLTLDYTWQPLHPLSISESYVSLTWYMRSRVGYGNLDSRKVYAFPGCSSWLAQPSWG